jgi:catechol 2,3-dioxygenase-like lactoylglutathione lyase family enzyme
MLGHLSFGVGDLQRAIAFYDAALGALGHVRVWTADNAAGYGEPGGNDRLALKLQTEPVVPPGPGFHLAFVAQSRAAVERFHAAALAAGGTDEGAPGLRPHYGPNYYAAFVRDPDGHKLEAVFQ